MIQDRVAADGRAIPVKKNHVVVHNRQLHDVESWVIMADDMKYSNGVDEDVKMDDISLTRMFHSQ